MSALALVSARLSNVGLSLSILFRNDFLDRGLCKNIFSFHICSFFLVFGHDFIRCVYFTRIAASNTASDDVTNYITYRTFSTDLSYSCAHFVVEIDEKTSLNNAF